MYIVIRAVFNLTGHCEIVMVFSRRVAKVTNAPAVKGVLVALIGNATATLNNCTLFLIAGREVKAARLADWWNIQLI